MAKRASVEVDSVEEFRDIISAGQPVLVDYYADWCGPCRALAPNVERVALAHTGRLRVVKVNIEALPELAERAKVREVPALHFYRDGQKVAVLNGFRTDEVLVRELTRYGLIDGASGHAGKAESEPEAARPAGTSLANRLLARLSGGSPRETTPENPTDAATIAAVGGATSFHFIESEDELVATIEGSFERPTALFLHDPWCPISARAFRQMERLGGELLTVDVSRQRGLNSVVERRTGVRHQSPQVIVLRDGVATSEASHGRITTTAVRAALGEPAVDKLAGPVR